MTNFTPNSEVAHGNARSHPKVASLQGLFRRAQNNAKHRGLRWDLSFADFIAVVNCGCFWCDAPPTERYNVAISLNGYTQRKFESHRTKYGWITYSGLDRIDNTGGYELKNVVPACKYCNFARNDRTVLEFRAWLDRITSFQKSLNFPAVVA